MEEIENNIENELKAELKVSPGACLPSSSAIGRLRRPKAEAAAQAWI
jgi:hypothetical protein